MAQQTAPLWKVEYRARKSIDDGWETKFVELYAFDRGDARGFSREMLEDDGWEKAIIRDCYKV